MEDLESKLNARKELIQVAGGGREADLLLRNCQLVNLFSEEIYVTDIAIYDGKIASISAENLPAKEQMDCSGLFATPGLIDGHVHIESTLLTPQSLAKIILPRGTTTLLIDPHEIANVSGINGVKAFLRGIEQLPLKLYIQIPSRVPTAPNLETTGGVIGVEQVKEMLQWEASIALGELDPSKVLPPLDEYILKVLLAEESGKVAVGHAAGLSGRRLDAYAAAGLMDDHECVTAEEAKERLRRGIEIMIREGTSERNLDELIGLVPQIGGQADFFFFCTDDKHVNDIETEGHIDFNVRKAIAAGIPPIKAIKMATLNCARHFRLDQRVGCLAPGRSADIVLTKSLKDFHADIVFANGERVAEGGRFLVDLPDLEWPAWTLNTVHISPLTPSRLAVPASGVSVRIRVIELVEDQIVNRAWEETLPVFAGQVLPLPERDILKMVCVDRHTASGNVGVGFVRGFKLRQGAIGSSVSHDHHNIVVVGTNDENIMCAIQTLQEMQGGFVAVRDSQVVGKLPLPLFGLMSLLPPEKLKKEIESLNQIAWNLGCRLKGPFMTLGFVSLPTVPELGLTDKGLVDVASHRLISLFV